MGFEYLCGWRLLSGQPLALFDHPHGEKKISYVSVGFPVFQFVLIVLYLPWIQLRRLRHFTPTHFHCHSHPQLHMEMFPCSVLLFSRFNNLSLLRLSSRESCSNALIIFGLFAALSKNIHVRVVWEPYGRRWGVGSLEQAMSAARMWAGNLLELPLPAVLLCCGTDNPDRTWMGWFSASVAKALQ